MSGPLRKPSCRARPRVYAAALVLCLCSTGCLFDRWSRRAEPFGPDAPAALSANPTLTELVEHLNRNTAKMPAWRCTNVAISSRGALGLPIRLGAMLAVEQPRNFRLMAHSPAANEVDLGSNEERFWFWIRQGKPACVFTARHDQLQVAQRQCPIPFQPDWIIEALGVISIVEQECVLTFDERNPQLAYLFRKRTSPRGDPVEMVTVVDSRHGLVLEHLLRDSAGALIARAKLLEHRQEPQSGAVLPHRVELEWPQEKLSLSLQIGEVEINPGVRLETFSLPEIPGYPPYDLGQPYAAGRARVSQSPH